MTQFTEQAIDQIFKYVGNRKILDPTVSLCHHCHSHIPAYRMEEDGMIYLVKYCNEHGVQKYIIETSAEFYYGLMKSMEDPRFNMSGGLLIETTDRCNLDCPHCYHLPDNDSADVNRQILIDTIKTFPIDKPGDGIHRIILAGAEPTLRPDFPQLCAEVSEIHETLHPAVMTNGIRFNNTRWLKESKAAGLVSVNVGLNHPSYHNHKIIRNKQETAINNIFEQDLDMGYISYTMIEMNELPDILQEIINSPWHPQTFRVRLGSEIGRNATQNVYRLSNLYYAAKEWCEKNNKSFIDINPADNNIYHMMVDIEGKIVRLIQWCDETNIDMEELRTGPWNYFVPHDGITNFLHQIIRRDTATNKGLELPDKVPARYNYKPNIEYDKSKPDLLKLY